MATQQVVKKKVDIVGVTEGQRKIELEKKRIKLAARKWEFVEYHDSGMMGSFALFNVPKEVDQQERLIKIGIGGAVVFILLIVILSDANKSRLTPEQEKEIAENEAKIEQIFKEKSAKDQAEADKYAATVKALIKQDIASVDIAVKAEGSVRWMFVALSHPVWMSMSRESRNNLVILLLRDMKKTYPNSGLRVSVGVNADQPLAEGEWGQLSDGPSAKLIGE